jgi:hypothetical protein
MNLAQEGTQRQEEHRQRAIRMQDSRHRKHNMEDMATRLLRQKHSKHNMACRRSPHMEPLPGWAVQHHRKADSSSPHTVLQLATKLLHRDTRRLDSPAHRQVSRA